MKNRGTYILLVVTLLFLAFTAGFFLGRNSTRQAVTMYQHPTETTQATAPRPVEKPVEGDSALVNINTASLPELAALPGIGEVIGQRIVDYRQEKGPFQEITQLSQVEGIGEKRMEELLPLITVGG